MSIVLILLLLLLAIAILPSKPNVSTRCKAGERQALLNFKQSLAIVDDDTNTALSSWGSEAEKRECCSWEGIECNNNTGHVVKLDLSDRIRNVAGTISPSLLQLHHLRFLNLKYNDFNGSRIPEFIGSLGNLRHLDLSFTNFSGPIPSQLGNLSRLETLCLGGDIDSVNQAHNVGKLEWLSRLTSLRVLDLTFSDLSQATDWIQVITSFRFLQSLTLAYCDLPSVITPSSSDLSFINASTSLTTLGLGGNNLTSSAIYFWLFNVSSSSLVYLDLSLNRLSGSIPKALWKMAGMKYLSLGHNQLEGGIPGYLWNMCNLQYLDLSFNHLSGHVFTFGHNNISRCTTYQLAELRLSENLFTGSVPNEIANLSSLQLLFLGYNRLNGTISENIGQLSNLRSLQLSGNCFNEVVISEPHFSNLSLLEHLDLSQSFLILKFDTTWIPPFYLQSIYLSSCKLGPLFPKWLQSQTIFFPSDLDISATGISDSLPDWFWDGFFNRLDYLNISLNQISGVFPNSSSHLQFGGSVLDVSSNNLTGPILQSIRSRDHLQLLNLSKNKFSGSIASICNISSQRLALIDLSHNLLHGTVPNCFAQWPNLQVINLANNNFSGPIPSSIASSAQLKMLNLRDNSFSKGLPLALKNCGDLLFMDVSYNELSENIPIWIGMSLQSLVFLNLGANQFNGSIPHQLCGLKSIRILDLSGNKISGTIPQCLSNFTSMAQNATLGSAIEHFLWKVTLSSLVYAFNYVDEAVLTWKGVKHEYAKILGLLLVIDFSSNKLEGEIPAELTSLRELVALNLSRNLLIGELPSTIGQLRQLQSFDLSRNNFSGSIPRSLSELTFLSNLDLSYNYLSGEIPTSTQLQLFDPSAFSHNHGLCGPPVTPNCSGPAETPQGQAGISDEEELMKWFYAGMGLGFVVGFWGLCGALLLKRSWRHSYFRLLDKVNDWLYVSFHLQKARLQRRIPT